MPIFGEEGLLFKENKKGERGKKKRGSKRKKERKRVMGG
jgi:hypothetical protein